VKSDNVGDNIMDEQKSAEVIVLRILPMNAKTIL